MWGGNWLEPTHNLLEVPSVTPDELIPRLLHNQPLPPHLLLPLLHEGTHHQCFHKPVGTTLAALRLHCRRLLRSKTERNFKRAENYYRRFVGAQIILRPILEGIALWAEHDGTPRYRLGGWSWLNTLFTTQQDSGPPQSTDTSIIVSLLMKARTTPAAQNRVCSVLTDPVKGGQDYLIGYLIIQLLSHKAELDSVACREPGFLLAFLTDYFFNDYALVDLILKSPLRHHCTRIADYIARRIEILLVQSIDTIFHRYNNRLRENLQCIESGKLTQGRLLPAFLDDEQQQLRGFHSYSSLLAEFNIEVMDQFLAWDNKDDDRPWSVESIQNDALIIMARGSIVLVDIPVEFTVPKDPPARVNITQFGRDLGRMPLNNPYPLGGISRRATLTIYFSIGHCSLTVLLRAHGRVISDFSVGNQPPSFYLDLLAKLQWPKTRILDQIFEGEDATDKFVSGTRKHAHENTMSRAREAVSKVLVPLALKRINLDSPLSKIKFLESGYLGLFEKAAAIRIYALNRTCVSLGLSIEETRNIFCEHGYQYDAALYEAVNACRHRGIPPIELPYDTFG